MVKNLLSLGITFLLYIGASAQSLSSMPVNASINGGSIYVQFNISTEIPIQLFEVHKLNNENAWELVKTLNHDGSSESYRVVDSSPFNGLNSYRVKIIETSGQMHYSQIEEIYFEPLEFDVMVYPNPANNWIVINSDQRNANFSAKLVNRYGESVSESHSRQGSLVLDTSQVVEGQYFVKVEGGGTSYTKSVVINHR